MAKIGRIISVRRNERPGISRLNSSASASPSTICTLTPTATKIAVTLSASPTTRSPKMRVKLVRPTNSLGHGLADRLGLHPRRAIGLEDRLALLVEARDLRAVTTVSLVTLWNAA